MNHAWWLLVLNALAVFRLSWLTAHDTITEPIRNTVLHINVGKGRILQVHLIDFLGCTWCVSIWYGAAVVALSDLLPHAWPYAAAGLAYSAVAGIVSSRT